MKRRFGNVAVAAAAAAAIWMGSITSAGAGIGGHGSQVQAAARQVSVATSRTPARTRDLKPGLVFEAALTRLKSLLAVL